MTSDELQTLTAAHPALLDSVVRWRGVGGWGATATIMRAIEVGALCVDGEDGSVSLELVAGVATPKRARSTGPYVERGHVEGLSSFDRHLLAMLFDDIADSPRTDISTISDFRRAHPLEYWTRLRAWRSLVDAEARRLRHGGRLQFDRRSVDGHRHALVDALHDASLSDRQWARIAGAAMVAGLDDVVAASASERVRSGSAGRIAGPAGVVWLASLRSGRRSGIDVLRRLFSPLRPSGYAPAQYTTLVLPPHRRLRVVDDGSLRLGG